MGENDELVRQDISLIAEIMRNKLAAFFIREKATGKLIADADEGELADFCIAVVQGAMLVGKIKRDSSPVEATVRQALRHLGHYQMRPIDRVEAADLNGSGDVDSGRSTQVRTTIPPLQVIRSRPSRRMVSTALPDHSCLFVS